MFATTPAHSQIGKRAFRQSVFAGSIYKVRATTPIAPAQVAQQWLANHCHTSVETLAATWRSEDWPKVRHIMQRFSQAPEILNAVESWANDLYMGAFHLGQPRLRVVFPNGHLVPEAAPAYLPHRDTWFANSQSQLNWWMPLLPIHPDSSFGFSPEHFDVAVENNSEQFDYSYWKEAGGFQRSDSQSMVYPTTTTALPMTRFDCNTDEYLCFSAAHVHQTMPIQANRARISFDFRTVARSDVQGLRASPNVDNRSKGCASDDYRYIYGDKGGMGGMGGMVGERP